MFALIPPLILTGCGTSIDSQPGRPLSRQDADRQYKANLLVLIDGKTTRSDVLNVMGPPDGVSDDKRSIVYAWTTKPRGGDELRRGFVLAAFDANNVLVRHHVFEDASRYGGLPIPTEVLADFARGERP